LANHKVAKSGLLPIKFDAPGHRSLFYHSGKNLLYIESPFADKNNLSRLGGIWSKKDPKGWSWYFTISNLEMLLDEVPFDTIDPKISEVAIKEEKRINKLEIVRRLALKDQNISLRVPGLKKIDGVSLRNYQKLGVQFSSLVQDGFLLGDEMGLGKCATKYSKIFVKKVGAISLEDVWANHSNIKTSKLNKDGEWRSVSSVNVLGSVNGKSTYQKATRIYREKVKSIAKVTLQDGSKNNVGYRHAFFTNENCWKKVKDISAGDWILVNKKINTKLTDKLDKEFAKFLSWQIAKGYESEGNSVTITHKDSTILKDLQIIFDKTGLSKSSDSEIKTPKEKSSYLYICSKEYKERIRQSFPDYKWGALSRDKIIPEKIVNSSDELIAEFLRNYFEAEGCCNKENIEVSSKSEKIIRSLHLMLRRLGMIGIVSSKTINTPKWGDVTYWKITIGGIYVREFQKKIGFLFLQKNKKLEILYGKEENTNLGNSIPCRHLIKKLVSLSGLTNKLAGMESSVYISSTSASQNPSASKTLHIINSIRNCLNNGLPNIGKSKQSSCYASIENKMKKNRLEIEDVLDQLRSMIYEDFVWMRVDSIENIEYNDYVYDLEIDGEHNYTIDMSLGHNSVQAIAISMARKTMNGASRCLVIAPASIKYNWKEEFEFWTNESFTIIDGPPNKRDVLWDNDDFFTVVNPELIVRDFNDAPILKKEFDVIVVDEIHMLKNYKSKRSEYVKKLRLAQGGIKIGLSGTPIDGRLEDLHSIFEFLVPNLFMTRGKFLDRYAIRDQYNSVVGYVNVNEINKTIKPFFLRRLKKDVAKELPEKIFKNVYIDLSTEERKIYNAIRNQSHKITEDSEAITAILRARQFCNAPGLVDEYPEFGAKYAACIDLLEEIIGSGHKVLVFSMFEQMVDKLYVQFEKNGWKCLKITGKVKKKDRPLIAKEFNEDPTIDICIMDEAGSTGLNFQEASYVMHYDDNWSPAIMKQRTDRAHRLTTKHVVTVVNFICRNTIEDHIREVLNDKDAISASAIGDNAEDVSAIKTLGAKDILKYL